MTNKLLITTYIKNPVVLTLCLLIAFALTISLVRHINKDPNKLAGGDTAWQLSKTYEVESQKRGAVIKLPIPKNTIHATLYSQSISHSGFIQKKEKINNTKTLSLVALSEGSYEVSTIYNIKISPLNNNNIKEIRLTETGLSKWLSSSENIIVNSPFASTIVDAHSLNNPDINKLIEKLYLHVVNKIRVTETSVKHSETALLSNTSNKLGINNALIALLRTARLPTRLVTGLDLMDPENQPIYWVETFIEKRWKALAPVQGHFYTLPTHYLPIQFDAETQFEATDTDIRSTGWAIEQINLPENISSSESKNVIDIFNLKRLSPSNRENLSLLLLLPIGVLFSELLRQFAGIRTYGTFSPSLMALAVVHSDWITTVLVFFFVAIFGLLIRSALPSSMNLSRTGRLAIVFTLVSTCMAMVTSGFIFYDPALDSSIVLLPVVILTMIVDRVYTIADQNGARTALVRLFWTCVAALISLVVLLQSSWGEWFVDYPESHAITLSLIIIIGLYNGPRLSDLSPLSWLHEPTKKPKEKSPPNKIETN